MDEVGHFELSFCPDVNEVPAVRRFVSEFYARLLMDADATSQLAVATHELLDNAVQYASGGNTSFRIGVRAEPDVVHVVLSTKNRASRAHLDAARSTLEALMGASDPVDHFLRVMRETARRAGGSGLGLARVRAESDMAIRYEIHEDVIELEATAAFKKGAAT
jgi:hypothetical protein